VKPIPEHATDAEFKHWKPVTQRRPFLFVVIFITLALLALVQVLVIYDQRNDGIIFASKISELGAGHLFLYRYLPTILAVTYAFVWHWIDIDARRIEPYRQLSRPGGATGSDSLLLHYPTDLLAFVPLKALKRKHWPVVISASTLVLVGMGLTPLQAAMFATETVTKSSVEPILLSNHRMSIADQEAQITANYTYSVANIVWLDERLPPFMTREAAFTPFKLAEPKTIHNNESLTGATTAFSVDVTCEPAVRNDTEKILTSSQGCRYKYVGLYGPSWTDVVGIDHIGDDIKEYTPFYAGYSGGGGNVNYYLSSSCPDDASNVFFVALGKNKRSATDPPPTITGLFCETAYYQQEVVATVLRSDGSIPNAVSLGPRVAMPSDLFNTSTFEEQLSNARQMQNVRGMLPSTQWPDQIPQLSKFPITVKGSLPEMSNVFGLAIGAHPRRDFEEYMDPQTLASSFQAAYRLLFARAMVDVLAADYQNATIMNGTRVYQIEAVRIVQHFAYAIEGLLGIVTLMAFTLLAVTWFNAVNLSTDPDSLSALMRLVNGQASILAHFSQHDQSSWALLKTATSRSTFMLERPLDTDGGTLKLEKCSLEADTLKRHHLDDDKPDFSYPMELSTVMGCAFALALALVLAGTLYLYQTSQAEGLALPSQNVLVRQMLENYLPTIIATLIEPVWVVLNRLMCLFQPFEELRSGNAPARRSVDLKYASLPPQFSLLKALRAKHIVLSAVCAMALLANVLAVAFSGLLDEETVAVAYSANATSIYSGQLKTDIAKGLGRINESPFYYAMANFTSGTPMPQWTDDFAFYLPASHQAALNQSDNLQLKNVFALGANLQCDPVGDTYGPSWNFSGYSYADTSVWDANITVTIPDDRGAPLRCSTDLLVTSGGYSPWSCSSQQIMAIEYMLPLTSVKGDEAFESDPCQGLLLAVWARKSTSELCGDKSYTISDDEATVMVCKPRVTIQSVNVTLTGEHRVLESRSKTEPKDFPGSDELIQQATHALWASNSSMTSYLFNGGVWHNDSFPSDWHSYVMNMMNSDLGVLDPNLPPPDFDLTVDLFTRAYQKTFAIWLGLEHERLLAPAREDDPVIIANIRRPEIRIVVSQPMTILSSSILGLYIVVAFAVYARRPGKFLPRMPLTMASDIALFAASKAVRELETADMSTCGPEKEEKIFGYGSFVGVDGKPHVGVERVPFVIPAGR